MGIYRCAFAFCVLASLGIHQAVAGSVYTFDNLAIPGNYEHGATLSGINDSGTIVGTAMGSFYVDTGLVLVNGVLSKVTFPNSSSSFAGIANNGSAILDDQITGNTYAWDTQRGTASLLNLPFIPVALNSAGQIVGTASQWSDSLQGNVTQGMLSSGGTETVIDFPDAANTSLTGINDAGEVVGNYTTGSISSGFSENNGVFTSIAYPGAISTTVTGINDEGDIVGSFSDPSELFQHGFLLHQGQYTEIDDPLALSDSWSTTPLAINDQGVIVGAIAGSGSTQGDTAPFIATPVPEPTGAFVLLLPALLLTLVRSRPSDSAAEQ